MGIRHARVLSRTHWGFLDNGGVQPVPGDWVIVQIRLATGTRLQRLVPISVATVSSVWPGCMLVKRIAGDNGSSRECDRDNRNRWPHLNVAGKEKQLKCAECKKEDREHQWYWSNWTRPRLRR